MIYFRIIHMMPPEKLEMKGVEMLRVVPFQFLALLRHFRSGWRANPVLTTNSRSASSLWTGVAFPERAVSPGVPVGWLVFNVGPLADKRL